LAIRHQGKERDCSWTADIVTRLGTGSKESKEKIQGGKPLKNGYTIRFGGFVHVYAEDRNQAMKLAMELIKKFEHNCLSEKMDDRRMDRRRSIAEVTEIWTDEVFLDDEV
jgi:hypothetical protein